MIDDYPLRFQALLETEPDSAATFIRIPFDVPQVFGSRGRVPVRGALNGAPFRGSLSPYGGIHYLGINRLLREQAGVQAGDQVEIVLERDDEPRQVALPPDLAQALGANAGAKAAWDKLSYSHQREHVQAVEEAKRPETRARRIEKTLAGLARIDPALLSGELQPHQRPAVMEVPAFVEQALQANLPAWENFSRMAPSQRRNYVRWIMDAKKDETRQKRLLEAIARLEQNQPLRLK